MVRKGVLFIFVSILLVTPAVAADFAVSFEWGDIPLCTSGRPNVVPNPRFALSDVPEGTKFIQFKMTDLDVPSYDHGGGTVKYMGQNVIEPGAFKYNSPCPPSGSHRYQWIATAKKKKGLFGGSIAKTKTTKKYPE